MVGISSFTDMKCTPGTGAASASTTDKSVGQSLALRSVLWLGTSPLRSTLREARPGVATQQRWRWPFTPWHRCSTRGVVACWATQSTKAVQRGWLRVNEPGSQRWTLAVRQCEEIRKTAAEFGEGLTAAIAPIRVCVSLSV